MVESIADRKVVAQENAEQLFEWVDALTKSGFSNEDAIKIVCAALNARVSLSRKLEYDD